MIVFWNYSNLFEVMPKLLFIWEAIVTIKEIDQKLFTFERLSYRINWNEKHNKRMTIPSDIYQLNYTTPIQKIQSKLMKSNEWTNWKYVSHNQL